MKAFKLTSSIMLIIAGLMLVVGIIIPATATDNTVEAAFITLVQLNAIIIACAGAGIFLMFSKNEVAKKVGNGLTVASFVAALFCAVNAMVLSGEMADAGVDDAEISIGAVIVIIAAVFLLLHYAFLIANAIVSKNSANINPSDDIRIERIREWKKLLDEGIISQEEYEEKRSQILQLNAKK